MYEFLRGPTSARLVMQWLSEIVTPLKSKMEELLEASPWKGSWTVEDVQQIEEDYQEHDTVRALIVHTEYDEQFTLH